MQQEMSRIYEVKSKEKTAEGEQIDTVTQDST